MESVYALQSSVVRAEVKIFTVTQTVGPHMHVEELVGSKFTGELWGLAQYHGTGVCYSPE